MALMDLITKFARAAGRRNTNQAFGALEEVLQEVQTSLSDGSGGGSGGSEPTIEFEEIEIASGGNWFPSNAIYSPAAGQTGDVVIERIMDFTEIVGAGDAEAIAYWSAFLSDPNIVNKEFVMKWTGPNRLIFKLSPSLGYRFWDKTGLGYIYYLVMEPDSYIRYDFGSVPTSADDDRGSTRPRIIEMQNTSITRSEKDRPLASIWSDGSYSNYIGFDDVWADSMLVHYTPLTTTGAITTPYSANPYFVLRILNVGEMTGLIVSNDKKYHFNGEEYNRISLPVGKFIHMMYVPDMSSLPMQSDRYVAPYMYGSDDFDGVWHIILHDGAVLSTI